MAGSDRAAGAGTPSGSAALDIVGHEWWHAFTALSVSRSGLRTLGSGLCKGGAGCRDKANVVEEAFADAVGESFEITIAKGGRIPGKTASNVIVGEDAIPGGIVSPTRERAIAPIT